jgi:tRNA A-37 threonylcarbamoyl transferase component Bud32
MEEDGEGTEGGTETWTDLEPAPSARAEARPLCRGTLLAGRYEIERVIGRGATGLVVRAMDRTLGETVAIKVIRAEYANEPLWAERMAREVRLARQINHPNVCHVYDLGESDGRVFLVMELATRGTLRGEISSKVVASRALDERIADARAIAAGLAAIHEAGIVHRDVSPQNLLRMEDGRLVLSDFGLATDTSESTTSIHGGTVAYMAPEVARGGRATFASDVWALGVVIHEAVFGERPRWRGPGALKMDTPEHAQGAMEAAVLDVCRACTAGDPSERVVSAREVVRRLSDGQIARRNRRRWKPPLAVAAGAVLALVAILTFGRHLSGSFGGIRVAGSSLTISAIGEPDDWTDRMLTLTRIEDRVHCAVVLPGRRHVRFVWGEPRRSEDLDTATGRKVSSPLVPAAYREGCPDVSPDGTRLLFPGHTTDGRAFAFVSTRPDGSDAQPVVAIAEPSVYSEPTWIDPQSFSYDVDLRHMGVFSLATQRTTVLPDPTTERHTSAFRHVIGSRVYVSAWSDAKTTDVSGYRWPSLEEEIRFRLPLVLADWRASDDPARAGKIYYSAGVSQPPGEVLELSLKTRQARRLGIVRDGAVDRILFVDRGLLLLTSQMVTRLELDGVDGATQTVRPLEGRAMVGGARCGEQLLVSESSPDGYVIARLSPEGAPLGTMTAGPYDIAPACNREGTIWLYSRFGTSPALRRCDEAGCRDLVAGDVWGSAISPDGKRVAFVGSGARGPSVQVVPIDGGTAREIAVTETICSPGWSTNGRLWISRRRGSRLVWTEVDPDTRRETGRIAPGTRDCMDGWSDPSLPDAEARAYVDKRSDLRLLPP